MHTFTRPAALAASCALLLTWLPGCSDDGQRSTTPSATAPATSSAATSGTESPTTPPVAATEPSTSAATGPKPLPPVKVVPGTYRLAEFAIPFDITVSGTWVRYAATSKLVLIGRGTNGETGLAITSGIAAGASALEAIASICPATEWGPTEDVGLLGGSGLAHEGVTTRDCVIGEVEPGQSLAIAAGHHLRLAAVEVGGVVVVTTADAPADDWDGVSQDFLAMEASLTPVG